VLCRPRGDAKNKSSEWRIFGLSPESEDRLFVFTAKRRPESFRWTIPDNDDDLLSGMGSRGTQAQKNDDTFETLLLMVLPGDDAC